MEVETQYFLSCVDGCSRREVARRRLVHTHRKTKFGNECTRRNQNNNIVRVFDKSVVSSRMFRRIAAIFTEMPLACVASVPLQPEMHLPIVARIISGNGSSEEHRRRTRIRGDLNGSLVLAFSLRASSGGVEHVAASWLARLQCCRG